RKIAHRSTLTSDLGNANAAGRNVNGRGNGRYGSGFRLHFWFALSGGLNDMKWLFSWLGLFVLLAAAPAARAQGVQTGTITGTVQSADGLSVPGVTVTATSPALQGLRNTVTDVNGIYIIRGLPPGVYAVAFEISGFKPATKQNLELTVGGTVEASQTLSVAGVAETVNVTAEAPVPAPLARPTLSQV